MGRRETAFGLGVALLLVVGAASAARADEPDASPGASTTAAPAPTFVSSRSIEDRIRESRESRRSVLDFGIRDAIHGLGDKVYDRVGLRFTFSYTMLYQHASGGSGPRDAAGDDVDLLGIWEPFRNDRRVDASLEAAFEGRNRYADITPSALSTTIDSLWSTTSGFNRQDFSLVQVYWRQALFDGRLHLRIGKLSPYASLFGNRFNSSSLFFVNYAFSDNPAVFMPGNGLGLHASWKLDEHWTLVLGIQNANGVKTKIDPSTLRYGEYWAAVQLQRTVDLPGLGKGTWRVGSWYVTPREVAKTDAGGGGVLSIDQELGTHTIAFLRYEYQGEGLLNPEVRLKVLTGTEQVVRGGLVFPGPIPAWSDDLIGVGGAWGKPAESGLDDSVVGEIFYRGQLESTSQLTFSMQMVKSSTVFERVFVFSVRYRLEL